MSLVYCAKCKTDLEPEDNGRCPNCAAESERHVDDGVPQLLFWPFIGVTSALLFYAVYRVLT